MDEICKRYENLKEEFSVQLYIYRKCLVNRDKSFSSQKFRAGWEKGQILPGKAGKSIKPGKVEGQFEN